jgi:glycyl-tRNA synthetase
VAVKQADQTEALRGPAVTVALDANGAYTKAAEGFARKNGVAVEALQRQWVENTEYVFAIVERKGQSATQVLAEALPSFITALKFGKTMRWDSGGTAFSRPIRWMVALFGGQVIPFEYAHAQSTAVTRGVRPLGSPEIAVQDVAAYQQAMTQQGIILDMAQRRQTIEAQCQALADDIGGRIPHDEGLLAEVTNLVEQPTALRGQFSERFLKLPREVLVTVMRKHQRYFAVENAEGDLLPYFIAVRNGDSEHLDKVIHGNEHVLVARFTDAEFFYNADVQHPLEHYLGQLSTLTFQEKLGSMLDKNNRVAGLVVPFGQMLDAADDLVGIAERAAQLAKADLGTQMVVELTSLQGAMGRFYAQLGGESPEVATAIFEHWLPRGAGDDLPSSAAGVLLALLDRLDSLVGLFAVGLEPTGASDPYALRRAALGLVQILLDRELPLDLRGAVALLAGSQPVPVSEEHQQAVLRFIAGRLEGILLEQGKANDVVKAVLAEQAHNPARALQGIKQLGDWVEQEGWEVTLDNFARCVRITRVLESHRAVNPDLLTLPSEQALFQGYDSIRQQLPQDYNIGDFLSAFAPHVPTVQRFFEEVLVMDENPAIRANRLGLLQAISSFTIGRADLSYLSGF